MTLQRRLEGVYRQYGPRRPDVAFATAEVLRSALNRYGHGGSVYFSARAPASLVDDMAAVNELNPAIITYPEAVALYFKDFIGRGHFYDVSEPAAIHTKYDKLVPWVAKVITSEGDGAIQDLLRGGALDRIADWYEAEHPDVMRFSLKQVLYRERRWHAAFARKKKADTVRAAAGEVVWRDADGWTAQKLTTAEQLNAEGEFLAHCVGGRDYVRRCADRLIEIYSLRDQDGAPRYTIEMFMGYADANPEEPGPLGYTENDPRFVRLRAVRQVKGLKNKRPKVAADCQRILSFLDQMPGITPFDAVYDLEHCLRKAGRWIRDIRDIKRNRRTSRRRTSRRVA